VRAIFQAALAVEVAEGSSAKLEIMLPFVSTDREIGLFAARFDAIAASLRHENGCSPTWQLGVMVETPRAALRCNHICRDAAFISFGTNDLTQMTYGLSRDDVGRFVRDYIARGALRHDPFHRLDEEGVGELLRIGTERGRDARPDLTVAICGEQGGDPHAIGFCEGLGMDYVSCSPYRTPASRLAAAQATIRRELAP
jgi:pyruvate,orthophosphate dikinase